MSIHTVPPVSPIVAVPQPPWRSQRQRRIVTLLLVTLAVFAHWKVALNMGIMDTDSSHYLAMAEGTEAIKPFAYRVLGPSAAREFAVWTGGSVVDGFLAVGVLSGWVLLYGVLSPLLRRRETWWLAFLLAVMPFWIRIFHNYLLPDLLHAGLCMVYLELLRRRWWAASAAILVPMFLARESTSLVVLIAVPVLWRMAGKLPAMLHLGGAVLGQLASKFTARHALANIHGINDTLYMGGKVPWNAAKNLFGIALWTNTLPNHPPLRVWDVPRWMHLGGIHQFGYSGFDPEFPAMTWCFVLASFGLGSCILLWLLFRAPSRKLFWPSRKLFWPSRKLVWPDEPYLCIAGVYGAVAFLLAPMLGSSVPRLLDYGWPLFLLYLPAVLSRLPWKGPAWVLLSLAGLHLVSSWVVSIGDGLSLLKPAAMLLVLLLCNGIALWLLVRHIRTEAGDATAVCSDDFRKL